MKHTSTILEAIALAQTEQGAEIVKNNYVGTEHFGDIYETQEAAALAALIEALECNDPEDLEEECNFSVHAAKRADGSIYYSADVGHNFNMTHTDDLGFCGFLENVYNFEPEWIEEISSGDFEPENFDMLFDKNHPYALN